MCKFVKERGDERKCIERKKIRKKRNEKVKGFGNVRAFSTKFSRFPKLR